MTKYYLCTKFCVLEAAETDWQFFQCLNKKPHKGRTNDVRVVTITPNAHSVIVST